MNVFLTIDVEVWCNDWSNLDRAFSKGFERYVYGRSAYGDYALPQTLAILNRFGLKGIFFVEPLFATRFGTQHLEIIVRLIRDAGHEIQLHLHPEWNDEAIKPIIKNSAHKRQHMSDYTLDEQATLIAFGKSLLEAAGSGSVKVFRAGNFAANRDTFAALSRNEILVDASLSRCYSVSAPDLRTEHSLKTPFMVDNVVTYPVMVFRDGFGKDRPAHLGASGFGEMRDVLRSARRAGIVDFVIVSHNFEMLRHGSSTPDWIVVRRFERLCAFLWRITPACLASVVSMKICYLCPKPRNRCRNPRQLVFNQQTLSGTDAAPLELGPDMQSPTRFLACIGGFGPASRVTRGV